MQRSFAQRLFGGWGRHPRDEDEEWAEDDPGLDDPETYQEVAPPSSLRSHFAPSLYRAEPRKLDEAEAIADRLKQGNPVIVSLEGADATEAQRIRDFLSGVCYALGGYIRKVAARVYACAPATMPIEVLGQDRSSRAEDAGLYGGATPAGGRGGNVWPE
jgi:cell division inhibitor SepF